MSDGAGRRNVPHRPARRGARDRLVAAAGADFRPRDERIRVRMRLIGRVVNRGARVRKSVGTPPTDMSRSAWYVAPPAWAGRRATGPTRQHRIPDTGNNPSRVPIAAPFLE